jgi:hypothetical protein
MAVSPIYNRIRKVYVRNEKDSAADLQSLKDQVKRIECALPSKVFVRNNIAVLQSKNGKPELLKRNGFPFRAKCYELALQV